MKALGFFLLILVSICGCDPADKLDTSLFQKKIIDPHPNTGKDCCTDVLMLGDINGDGKLDLVVGAEHAKNAGLVWYQNPTWQKHSVASGEFTTDGQTADLDGDSDVDIVIGNYALGKEHIDWFENVSGTGQNQWIQHTLGKSYAHDLEIGDMDGDGDMDIVTCDKKRVILWEQVTPHEFREHMVLERQGEGLKLADIDGDQDLDIVFGGSWLENPGYLNEQWISHLITDRWSPDTRVFVVDMNKDGRLDIVLSASEGKGEVSWFESPVNPKTGVWNKHSIEKKTLDGAHSLQVADLDNDGDSDVVVAEMHTSPNKRVLVYFNEAGVFRPMLLADTGSHNMRVGDIDGDGDIDIVGKNYAGPNRMIEMWENQASNIKQWSYHSIDTVRPKNQKGMMGLIFTDVDRDGFTDVVAGSFLYRNPDGCLFNSWARTELPENADVYFAVDVNGNQLSDLIGIAGDTVFWMEALDEKASAWKTRPVGKVAPRGRTQGYIAAKLMPSQKPQLIFTRGKNHLYVLDIPPNPMTNLWPLHLISTETEEEGLAVGDIDRDGDLDITAVKADGQNAIWLENPGSLSVNWASHGVGKSPPWMDRIALADINGDGMLDFITTEERQDWKPYAALSWFEAPADPKQGPWRRRIIARHRSLNNMDIADFNGDGFPDIVVAEHTDLREYEGATDNLTLVYLNRYRGRHWLPDIVEQGPHSSHLGARLVDLDHDGVMEIVSIGWNQYPYVHLWSKSSRHHRAQ